jgi:HTH-type transcriptional regulator/antitoxin HigA
MEINRQVYSDLAIPPGEYLLEAVTEKGITQSDLARRMGRPEQKINEIVKGSKAITPDTALQLEQVLGVPAHIWTGLEADYQLIHARQQVQQDIEREAIDIGRFPYAEMAKQGWVTKTRKPTEKVRELRRFFGVASLANLADVKSYAPAFRKSNHQKLSHEALAAWLRAGALQAEEISAQPFNKKTLKSLLPHFRQLTLKSPDVFQPELRKCLADAGVALVLLPHLSKTYTHGATFWVNPHKAVLMMTIRGKWADVFWFSLFHELAHILLHDKRQIFLEDGCSEASTKEREADQFACHTLIPERHYRAFIKDRVFTAHAIKAFARQVHIAPGIVTGRLQHDGFLAYTVHESRVRYQWANE